MHAFECMHVDGIARMSGTAFSDPQDPNMLHVHDHGHEPPPFVKFGMGRGVTGLSGTGFGGSCT